MLGIFKEMQVALVVGSSTLKIGDDKNISLLEKGFENLIKSHTKRFNPTIVSKTHGVDVLGRRRKHVKRIINANAELPMRYKQDVHTVPLTVSLLVTY